jgi:hypothetical protein
MFRKSIIGVQSVSKKFETISPFDNTFGCIGILRINLTLKKKTFYIKTRYKYDNLKIKHMVHKMDTLLEIRI